MRQFVMAVTVAAVAGAFSFGPAAAQSDQEKAWATCVAAVKNLRSDDPSADRERTAAFKACMERLGYKP